MPWNIAKFLKLVGNLLSQHKVALDYRVVVFAIPSVVRLCVQYLTSLLYLWDTKCAQLLSLENGFSRLYFLGGQRFWCQHQAKKSLSGSSRFWWICIFFFTYWNFIVGFVVYFQGVTDSYLAHCEAFSIALDCILDQWNWSFYGCEL